MPTYRVLIPVDITIDQALLDHVLTDAWRSHFYPFTDAADVVTHLAFNLVQDRPLSSLDGFADQPSTAVSFDIAVDGVEVERKRIKPSYG